MGKERHQVLMHFFFMFPGVIMILQYMVVSAYLQKDFIMDLEKRNTILRLIKTAGGKNFNMTPLFKYVAT